MYQIISDGSCDLPKELVKEKGVEVVPFYVSFDEKTYLKEMEEIPVREFYDKMVEVEDVVYPKSSLPSVSDYAAVFEKYAKEEMPIICICISTKFSGSYQSAMSAKDEILESYPQERIVIIDSMMDTVLQGMFVLEAVSLREKGIGFDETVDRLLAIRDTGRIFFTVGGVSYLKHGGRIGKVAGAAASLLDIRPLITLKEGEIFSSGLARSRKKSLESVMSLLEKHIRELISEGCSMKDYTISIGYGYDIAEAEDFLKRTKERFRDLFETENIRLYQIGATIAVHTGPHALGYGFLKKA